MQVLIMKLIFGYEVNNLVKVGILINGDPVDALSLIVHKDRSIEQRGRALCERLKDLIPRQQIIKLQFKQQ